MMAGLCLQRRPECVHRCARAAGVDEAGRGPLAGPVVAAAVVLPDGFHLPGLADSKVLPARVRAELHERIRECAVGVGIGVVAAGVIDEINILQATHRAMREAVAQLSPAPEMILVDGRPLPRAPRPQQAIVGGDATCACIAAASIVAKVTRDRMMVELDVRCPGYGFARHKGYPTPEHRARLEELGPCPEHRQSFRPVRAAAEQLRLPEDRGQ
jgi:ribonuclease HII